MGGPFLPSDSQVDIRLSMGGPFLASDSQVDIRPFMGGPFLAVTVAQIGGVISCAPHLVCYTYSRLLCLMNKQ
uniref:Uncharacterized protein n=1 Tax=Romanomermis culicivorax TaxID=13658 RepID=A0A915JLC8_ROMCU